MGPGLVQHCCEGEAEPGIASSKATAYDYSANYRSSGEAFAWCRLHFPYTFLISRNSSFWACWNALDFQPFLPAGVQSTASQATPEPPRTSFQVQVLTADVGKHARGCQAIHR
mmetsp:Transcript_60472/g.146040  ORF Transcript_60472/g.146040 Transcript_60472/m.146040 type:complete len:113 (+) Transcript_60472:1-339(+)